MGKMGHIATHAGEAGKQLYDTEDGRIINEQIVNTNGSGHGALAEFLQSEKVDALICGGIGMGAQMALADAGYDLAKEFKNGVWAGGRVAYKKKSVEKMNI